LLTAILRLPLPFTSTIPSRIGKKEVAGMGKKDKGRNEKEQNVKRYGGDGKRREEREWKVAEA